MINLLNNIRDNVLKPCSKEEFESIVASERVKQLIEAYRNGDKEAKLKLPAITCNGVLSQRKYRQYLDQCKAQGISPQISTRQSKLMRPTGLVMLDYDHVDEPQDLYHRFVTQLEEKKLHPQSLIALAHITASNHGLRLVLRREKGLTIVQEMERWSQMVGHPSDSACKDLARLSLLPQQADILYYNPELLFAEFEDFTDDELDERFNPDSLVTLKENKEHIQDPCLNKEEASYCGVPLERIVSKTIEHLGGMPIEGERHNFIMNMATRLRWVLDFDPKMMTKYIPICGLPLCEYKKIINDMSDNNRNFESMPREVAMIVADARNEMNLGTIIDETTVANTSASQPQSNHDLDNIYGSAKMPQMPETLPEVIRIITSAVPNRTQGYAAIASFAAMGIYLENVRFSRPRNIPNEPCFMVTAVGLSSTGKSDIDHIIKFILAPKYAEADEVEKKIDVWKNEYKSAPQNQKPAKPAIGKQILNENCTYAAKLEQLKMAAPRRLFVYTKEMESLYKLNEGRGEDFYRDICHEYDCDRIGSDRISAEAVSGSAIFRLNWIAHTTPDRLCKQILRYKAITGGALSRLNVVLLPKMALDEWSLEANCITYFEDGNTDAQKLMSYLSKLETYKNITLSCPQAREWYEKEFNKHLSYAKNNKQESYMNIASRAIEIGYYRAMMLWMMNDLEWTTEIEEFASWSIEYDLWGKLKLFGDAIIENFITESEAYDGSNGRSDCLNSLPNEFTYTNVENIRSMLGKSTNRRDTQNMINKWKSRGQIILNVETGKYEKAKKQH